MKITTRFTTQSFACINKHVHNAKISTMQLFGNYQEISKKLSPKRQDTIHRSFLCVEPFVLSSVLPFLSKRSDQFTRGGELFPNISFFVLRQSLHYWHSNWFFILQAEHSNSNIAKTKKDKIGSPSLGRVLMKKRPKVPQWINFITSQMMWNGLRWHSAQPALNWQTLPTRVCALWSKEFMCALHSRSRDVTC